MSVEQRGHISQIMINTMHTFKTAQGNMVHKHVASITGVILRLSFFFFFGAFRVSGGKREASTKCQ